MIKNPILFIIDNNGDYLRYGGILRAINGYREFAFVISPRPLTDSVSMSIMTNNANYNRFEQYVLPTAIKVNELIEESDALYQTIADWNVFGVEIKPTALADISNFRSGATTFSFQFQTPQPSTKCVTYKGVFGVDSPLPTTGRVTGDYYECEDWNFYLTSGTQTYTFTKGMYVYFNGSRWIKDALLVELNTSTVSISVEPSHAVGYEIDDDDANYLASIGAAAILAQQTAEQSAQDVTELMEVTLPTIEQDITEIDGRLDTAESEINNIKNGTTIVKKAEQDKNGNDIVNTYETKVIVSGINSRVTSLETQATTIYDFKGSVAFESLPTTGQKAGDTYNITNNFTLGGQDYLAGTNVSWNGTTWDALASRIPNASEIDYDNTVSGMAATTVQGAIDELDAQVVLRVETIVTVKKSGGDFNTLRSCFETIEPTYEKPYIVELYEGVWDMNVEYGDVWEEPSFYGCTIPDHVTLIGIGRKEEIIITASNGSNQMSTLNLVNTSGMENLTVTADSMRYVIHDDFADNVQPNKLYFRNVKDCVFVGSNLLFASTYGAGVQQGAIWSFKNCKFINEDGIWAFSLHNNVNWELESYVEIESCEFVSNGGDGYLVFGSLTTNANDVFTRVYLKGNMVNHLALIEEEPVALGKGILFTVNGYGNKINNVHILNSDGQDYSSYINLLDFNAKNIYYDPSTSGLSSYDVKDAIDELSSEKANKQQESWFTPTLLNGWVVTDGHPFQMRKTEFGQVVFRGSIKNGTLDTVAFELPVGYRVPNIITHPILIDNSLTGNTLYASGQYVVLNGGGSVVVLDGISFYVD